MIRWSALAYGAALALALASAAAVSSGESQPISAGMLDEHSAIEYAVRPTTDRVTRLAQALTQGPRSLDRDPATGFLLDVLEALQVPIESQLLVFSKTGLQRSQTSPDHPRALYFNESVAVGYIPGAPTIELASHDAQQGVVFHTLDQTADRPTLTRRVNCLTCHVSASTLDVPGMIVRSNMVGGDGQVMPQLGSHTVNHGTPHTERWGGWFVTGNTARPPYGPLGHRGNLTVSEHPSAGPAILSDRALIDWLGATDRAGYPSTASDIAALLLFDHQMHAINLMTRLNWEARVAAARGVSVDQDRTLAARAGELADYLLFVGEAPPTVEVTPPPGLARALLSSVPRDRRGRSLGELDLVARLLRYPCSYMVYTEAFDGLPPDVRGAVYARMLDVLKGKSKGSKYAHLSAADRRAVREILRDTKKDFPR